MFKRKRTLIAIVFLITSIIAIITLRNYVFEIAITSGESMEPAILPGDHVLIDRLAYRSYEPQKDEIIAIKLGYVMMIKRVLGTPGDVIEIRNGYLFRNGELVDNEQLSMPNKIRKNPKAIKIWDKHLYVIGDNREYSEDSRDFGLVTYDQIVGKAVFIYFPFERIGKIGL
jgi:signal peptidase I